MGATLVKLESLGAWSFAGSQQWCQAGGPPGTGTTGKGEWAARLRFDKLQVF
jgi:hypothetical protein